MFPSKQVSFVGVLKRFLQTVPFAWGIAQLAAALFKVAASLEKQWEGRGNEASQGCGASFNFQRSGLQYLDDTKPRQNGYV